MDHTEWAAEFSQRFERHRDELKWLYSELYHNDMQAYDYFLRMLYRSWQARPESLKALDRQREQQPAWFKGHEMVGMLMYVNAFAGTLQGVRARLDYLTDCGINYLHLMPLLESPKGRSDGGYAVSDFRKVQPELGTMEDLTDFSTRWLPSSLTLIHFQNAYLVMDYTKSFIMTANLAFISSLFQTAVCALTGYGFAKFDFPLKKIWLGVLLLCYLLPAQVLAVPNYLLFNQLGLIDGSLRPFIITSMLGKGINSSLCVLIFYMFYRQMPAVLLEAAEIDGASNLKAFTRIALPMVVPGIIVVLIFSIVWYWNDTYLASTYIGYANLSNVNTTGTLMLQLDLFEGNYAYASIGAVNSPYKFSMAKKAAATMLAIAPVMIIYFFVQRKFMQSRSLPR